ncbi:MAG: hypothetical protein E6R06_10885 [Mycobacterium sp.]|nr:MAG: hypothetical protein E6R06_10885 [Mycobacterium sp.]
MPTAADALALQLVLSDLSTEVIADLVALWRKYSDDPEFAALLLAAFPEIIGPYTQAGALVSAQWYTEQAPDLPYVATPHVDLPAERLSGSVSWALYAPGTATPLERLSGSVKRMIYDASRQTVLHNLQTEYGDPPGGSFDDEPGTRWARYASANACSFCRLMATRGAVYRSKASAERVVGRSIDITNADRRQIAAGYMTRDEALARRATYSSARGARKAGRSVGDRKTGRLRGTRGYGGKYHDHCRCIAVPVRPGTSYEPPDYVEKWEDDYIAATRTVSASGADTGGKSELNAILREMDAIDSRRREGQPADPIEMVDIEVHGRDGAPKSMRVPADSPAARAYTNRNGKGPGAPDPVGKAATRALIGVKTPTQSASPETAGGRGGDKPPADPPTGGKLGAADQPEEPPFAGHTKGYVHPHRAPVWSEAERQQRQRALPVDLQGEQLYQHEIETVERLTDRGEQLEWIPRDDRLPTSDFRWLSREGIEVDTKATKAKYESVGNQLRRSVEKARAARERGSAVRKDNFLVDLGRRQLSPKLEGQLSEYNRRNPENLVQRLWVLSADGRKLTEINLA